MVTSLFLFVLDSSGLRSLRGSISGASSEGYSDKNAVINHSPVSSTQQAIPSSLRGRAAMPVMFIPVWSAV